MFPPAGQAPAAPQAAGDRPQANEGEPLPNQFKKVGY